jgi:hypothetical protein
MTKKSQDSENFTFLLRCPEIHLAPTVVTAVVEETLVDLLLNGEGPKDWGNEFWHWDNLQDRLFDEDGEIVLTAQGPELWEFMQDPHHQRRVYADQVAACLEKFRTCNEPYIHSISENYDLQHLTVIRAFRNQWLMLAEGVKK